MLICSADPIKETLTCNKDDYFSSLAACITEKVLYGKNEQKDSCQSAHPRSWFSMIGVA